MGQLPVPRVLPLLVVEHTGVKYAKSVLLKMFQSCDNCCYEAWIVVFVCLSTLVHLDAVIIYSSDGFHKTFGRFTSRRSI